MKIIIGINSSSDSSLISRISNRFVGYLSFDRLARKSGKFCDSFRNGIIIVKELNAGKPLLTNSFVRRKPRINALISET